MTDLELLAPARNADIGIAAIDCGADAIYIAGPDFGARKAAWNEIDEISRLCGYAHQFGARVFLTLNTSIDNENELEKAHDIALSAQDAGVDAFIIRDTCVASWKDINIPLHASTQCAIRTPDRAAMFEDLGCGRLILERQLSLEQIKQIRERVDCELEFFVHGALCVGYSGECRLSEYLNGRSADKGDCIQACRSLYDLQDAKGNVLVRNKALLSLKDYNLKSRLSDLIDAGISSFKIEGRLKNASYVRNITRDYDLALNDLISRNPDKYARASFGIVKGGFSPDADKTFNRGYTELFIDGQKGNWSSSDAPKSMGEELGKVVSVKQLDRQNQEIVIRPSKPGIALRNGDGFAYVNKNAVCGFRGDVCDGLVIRSRLFQDITPGTTLFRNINSAFEKELDTNVCKREIPVSLLVRIEKKFKLVIEAVSSDGRTVSSSFECDCDSAQNKERAEAMLKEGLSKRSGAFVFDVSSLKAESGEFPLLSSATINGIRRCVASDLSSLPVSKALFKGRASAHGVKPARNEKGKNELLRSKYCIRYELGLCPVHQKAKDCGPLFLINNGKKLALGFDCASCEMTVSSL